MCQSTACADAARPLTFETMLTDPMIRLVMVSDGVAVSELLAAMEVARTGLVARELHAIRCSGSVSPAA
jgi:hypothetical protein